MTQVARFSRLPVGSRLAAIHCGAPPDGLVGTAEQCASDGPGSTQGDGRLFLRSSRLVPG